MVAFFGGWEDEHQGGFDCRMSSSQSGQEILPGTMVDKTEFLKTKK